MRIVWCWRLDNKLCHQVPLSLLYLCLSFFLSVRGLPPAVLLMLEPLCSLSLSPFPLLYSLRTRWVRTIPDAQQCQECAISEVLLDNPLPSSSLFSPSIPHHKGETQYTNSYCSTSLLYAIRRKVKRLETLCVCDAVASSNFRRQRHSNSTLLHLILLFSARVCSGG